MPLFEYRCEQCEKKFALLEGMTAEKAKRVCPRCGGKKLTKLISRIARPPKGEDDFEDADLDGMDEGDFDDEDL